MDLLINATLQETRIALVDQGKLIEFHLERPTEKGLVGNVYLGRVVRVLPGMQAAFVDIGLERTSFLYVDDLYANLSNLDERMENDDPACSALCGNGGSGSIKPSASNRSASIEDLLVEGQDILVQICKEPIGSKGARLTCNITLPCRNLVFMPRTEHTGISRKITNDAVRQRLRDTIERLRPPGAGFIVRTVAEEAEDGELEADMEYLMVLWDEIQDLAAKAQSPSPVYQDLDISLRSIRDLVSSDIARIIVDDRATMESMMHFTKTFVPEITARIELYSRETPLFDAYGIEMDISHALEKKVWLRSGGSIIIETTEALTVIDVNTGRYVGKTDLEETIFRTNMEAVREIAYQVRLRNIGGIIIIDFIDMESDKHRAELFAALHEAFHKDKNRTNILDFSEFGLVQMTRKRCCENLSQIMCEPCSCCKGKGVIKSRKTICYEIFRKVNREASRNGFPIAMLKVHPKIADLMLEEDESVHKSLELLEKNTGKRISIETFPAETIEKHSIIWKY